MRSEICGNQRGCRDPFVTIRCLLVWAGVAGPDDDNAAANDRVGPNRSCGLGAGANDKGGNN